MLLIDSDVLLDIAFARAPHVEPATQLLERVQLGTETAFVAWHTVSNVFYQVSKQLDRREARRFIEVLLKICVVAETGNSDMQFAMELEMSDFEDAMQVAAARACGARFIVSRNKRDFKKSPIRAYPPAEALALLS